MKVLFLHFLFFQCLFGPLLATSQKDSTKILYTSAVDTLPTNDSTDIYIQKKLIELALNSPFYTASNYQNKIREQELKKARSAWLNLLAISTNYNDQSFANQATTNPIVYPKYFFGLTIPLGVIFSSGSNIKSAKAAVAYGKEEQIQLARTIEADILTKYNNYKLHTQLIKIQIELINDISAQVSSTEENFRKGIVTVDSYLTALRTNNEELSKLLTLRNDQKAIQLEIEKIIGVPLEQVLSQSTSSKP